MSTSASDHFLFQNTVAVQQASSSSYAHADDLIPTLREIGRQLGWGTATTGTFGNIIPAGARVLVKPNLVLHENTGPWSFDAVITHPSFVRAVAAELLLTSAATISVGDSPIQGCDFERLLRRTKLDIWSRDLIVRDTRFTGIHDFRRTICTFEDGIRRATEDRVDLRRYVLFDIGLESLLEPITTSEPRFRVTCYDPKFLARTHAPGRHQYLVAKDVMESDVIINLPKLKMHTKAGVTNALKNVVGINGNKEYLPHHRIGGSSDSGDCYPGKSRIKQLLEALYDFQNGSPTGSRARMVATVLRPLSKLLSISGDETGIEGSWSGNDTVWRMSLDLNRILLYGRADGSMAEIPQRIVLHICDGIVAGQGSGPLAPEPFNLGLILAGENAAAIDLVGAHLLGMDPEKIPIIRGAFDDFRWPLTRFSASDAVIRSQEKPVSIDAYVRGHPLPQARHVPTGWSSVVRHPV